jgi:monoterpene epsilon-lactone hydrolase
MSVQNLLITKVVLPVLGHKRRLATAERTRRHIAKRSVRPVAFAPPRGLDRRAIVSLRYEHGWPVYDLAPRRAKPVRHVLYLHGGAYTNEIVRTHWSWLGRLVKEAPCRCLVPIYPLGARLGAAETVSSATELARELVEEAGAERVVLMGDSAGGGMSLAVAQTLRDQGATAGRIVLISPWLDVATNLPEQQAIAPRDAMLAIPGLVEAGREYAGNLPLDDPHVSPIHGDMRNLPPITVFIGTDDLLNPDSHRLRDACADAGVAVEFIEAPRMPHVYPLLPTPEGRAARRHIVDLLRTGSEV